MVGYMPPSMAWPVATITPGARRMRPMTGAERDHLLRLLAQSPKEFDLSGYVRFWLGHAPKATGNLRVQVDIDPQSFF